MFENTDLESKSPAQAAAHRQLPANLVEALQRAKTIDRPGLGFVQQDLSTRELTWKQIAREAELRAAQLLQLGLVKGQRVGMFAHSEEPFTLTFFGAVLAGLIPVPMGPPSPMGSAELQLQRLSAILIRSGASCVVGPADLGSTLESLRTLCPALESHATYEQLAASGAPPAILPAAASPSLDDVCFLQFTSGSTSQPKGVVVTHGNVVANTMARHRLHGTDMDTRVGVSWAPLFHDMGLIGSLLPSALFHTRHVFIPTMLFVRKPQIWLETIHRYRGTTTTANNFALRVAARKLPTDASLDLSCLQAIIIGGEPIHRDTAESFIAALRPHGLNAAVLSPAYGLAEATLAISITRYDEPLRELAIARDAYERGEVRAAKPGEPSLHVVDCGAPLPDHEIAIICSNGNLLAQDRVGEIVVRGPSVCHGYYGDAEATREVFRDGWLRTGDLGFLHEGRLFVSGRVKDLIIVAGRNHYPQDIEWAVAQLAGVRSHHVIAFSVPGTEAEQLIVVCERVQGHDPDDLERRIREIVVREIGVLPHDIVMAEPGTLPQTSSGKPRRRQAREDYLSRRLDHPSRSETGTRE